VLLLMISGGERGTVFGVKRGETKNWLIPAAEPMVDVDILTF